MYGYAETPGRIGKERRTGRARRTMYFSSVLSPSVLFPFVLFYFVFVLWETVGRRQGNPTMTGYAGPGQDEVICEKQQSPCHGPSGRM